MTTKPLTEDEKAKEVSNLVALIEAAATLRQIFQCVQTKENPPAIMIGLLDNEHEVLHRIGAFDTAYLRFLGQPPCPTDSVAVLNTGAKSPPIAPGSLTVQ
jgi:hypothetical protein